MIAKALNITSTSIHYHFGNKNHWVEVMVSEYVAEATKKHSPIWLELNASLQQKVANVVAYNYQLYKKYNQQGNTKHPWSLIGRLRLESDVLSDATCDLLASFTRTMRDAIGQTVEYARRQGQLKPGTPRDDLIFLLTHLVAVHRYSRRTPAAFRAWSNFSTPFHGGCYPCIPPPLKSDLPPPRYYTYLKPLSQPAACAMRYNRFSGGRGRAGGVL